MRFAVDQCQQSSREQLCRWIDWRFVTPTTAATATIFGIGISAGDSHRSRSISADCQCDADVKSTATRTRTQWWRCFRRKFFSTWHKLATKMRHQRDWFCAVRIFFTLNVCKFIPTQFISCIPKDRANNLFKHCCQQYAPEGCHSLCQYETDELTARNMVVKRL